MIAFAPVFPAPQLVSVGAHGSGPGVAVVRMGSPGALPMPEQHEMKRSSKRGSKKREKKVAAVQFPWYWNSSRSFDGREMRGMQPVQTSGTVAGLL